PFASARPRRGRSPHAIHRRRAAPVALTVVALLVAPLVVQGLGDVLGTLDGLVGALGPVVGVVIGLVVGLRRRQIGASAGGLGAGDPIGRRERAGGQQEATGGEQGNRCHGLGMYLHGLLREARDFAVRARP